MGFSNDQLFEVELVKSEIEHKEPIVVGFSILRNAKLKMLELYYTFFDKYCNVKKFEELEMDTDSLFPVLSEHDLYDCVRPAMKKQYNSLRSPDCTDEFPAKSTAIFFPCTCCARHKKHVR